MSTVQSQLKSHKNLQIITLYNGKSIKLQRQYTFAVKCLASSKTLATFELKHNSYVGKNIIII